MDAPHFPERFSLDEMRSVGARTSGGALISAVRLVRSETPVDRQGEVFAYCSKRRESILDTPSCVILTP